MRRRAILALLCGPLMAWLAAYAMAQDWGDTPYVQTPQNIVDRMLELAKVGPKDYVIDLGSGDGRTVITAAKRGVRALGVEYNPDLVALSKRAAAQEGLNDELENLDFTFGEAVRDTHAPNRSNRSDASQHLTRHVSSHYVMSFSKFHVEPLVIHRESAAIQKSDRDRDRRRSSPRSPEASQLTDRADTDQIAETKAQFAIAAGPLLRSHDAIWLGGEKENFHGKATKVTKGRGAAADGLLAAPIARKRAPLTFVAFVAFP